VQTGKSYNTPQFGIVRILGISANNATGTIWLWARTLKGEDVRVTKEMLLPLTETYQEKQDRLKRQRAENNKRVIQDYRLNKDKKK
jgi:hypothetical protein